METYRILMKWKALCRYLQKQHRILPALLIPQVKRVQTIWFVRGSTYLWFTYYRYQLFE